MRGIMKKIDKKIPIIILIAKRISPSLIKLYGIVCRINITDATIIEE